MSPRDNVLLLLSLTHMSRYERPRQIYFRIVHGLLWCRKTTLRHLCLPRPDWLPFQYLQENENEFGRYNLCMYDNLPLYVRATLWKRLNPQAWLFWMLGRPIPGDDKVKLCPEGYRIEELGPHNFHGRGQKEMEATKRKLSGQDRKMCPFSA